MKEAGIHFSYLKEGARIYEQSFAIIRRETDLADVPVALQPVVIRMIHSCGMVDLVDDIAWSDEFAPRALEALRAGRPVFCDTHMVASGITRKFLPAGNEIICTLSDPQVADRAQQAGTTRTAAAIDLWGERANGALVVIGNAPTALFHLMERVAVGALSPAAVIATPVGFVGAAESKQALAGAAGAPDRLLPFLTVFGRRGGSAIACGAVNGLALAAKKMSGAR